MESKVTIYTDGACRGNPGIGGWGAILIYGDVKKEIYGAEPMTTNNRMELLAAINSLLLLKRPMQVELYTDSQYLQQGMKTWVHQWQKKSWRTSNNQTVKNSDLWQQLVELEKKHSINWHWVRGHSGDFYNERADRLANYAIDQLLK